jgi:opacity protein-like surface antigen
VRKWFLFSVILLAMSGLYSAALARPIGVGALAGVNIPIVQDDAGSGFLYGAKLRIGATPFLALEPTLIFFEQGDVAVEVGGEEVDLDGGKSTALGINLIIGSVGPPAGLRFHGIVGLASHAMKQEGTEDESRFALTFGPGLEVQVGEKLALDFEVLLHMISLADGGARKNLGLSGGLIYYVGN